MSTYPTGPTRGRLAAPSGGSPIPVGAIAAGFLAPAASAALAALDRPPVSAPPVRLPVGPPPQTVPTALGRTAGLGIAGRLFWPIAFGLLAYGIWAWWRQYSKARLDIPQGWVLGMNCRQGDKFTGYTTFQNCGSLWYIAANNVDVLQPPPFGLTFSTGVYVRTGVPGAPTSQEWLPGQKYSRPNLPFVPPPAWKPGVYLPDMDPSGNPRVPGSDPANDAATRPAYDPMSQPPGLPMPMVAPRVLPWRLLPKRQANPARSPMEQPQRGNSVPLYPGISVPALPRTRRVSSPFDPLPWPWPNTYPEPADPVPYAPGEPTIVPEELPGWWVDPAHLPLPLPPGQPAPAQPQPGDPGPVRNPYVDPRVPVPGPGVQPVPGVPPQPVKPPKVKPAKPPPKVKPGKVVRAPFTGSGHPVPIRTENPQGSIGSTVIVGGGPRVGRHERSRPKRKTKERKVRRTMPGAVLIRRGVNPVTEALDTLECAYKNLPKGFVGKFSGMTGTGRKRRPSGTE